MGSVTSNVKDTVKGVKKPSASFASRIGTAFKNTKATVSGAIKDFGNALKK